MLVYFSSSTKRRVYVRSRYMTYFHTYLLVREYKEQKKTEKRTVRRGRRRRSILNKNKRTTKRAAQKLLQSTSTHDIVSTVTHPHFRANKSLACCFVSNLVLGPVGSLYRRKYPAIMGENTCKLPAMGRRVYPAAERRKLANSRRVCLHNSSPSCPPPPRPTPNKNDCVRIETK